MLPGETGKLERERDRDRTVMLLAGRVDGVRPREMLTDSGRVVALHYQCLSLSLCLLVKDF